uniref:Uncharacterized protein n=1 Tax=Gasterosteus aculeatus TaxID=69293 RepID=G3PQ53_GASAC
MATMHGAIKWRTTALLVHLLNRHSHVSETPQKAFERSLQYIPTVYKSFTPCATCGAHLQTPFVRTLTRY